LLGDLLQGFKRFPISRSDHEVLAVGYSADKTGVGK
jgi:hypothetical protein